MTMRFSLVVATLGRTGEIDALMGSLARQGDGVHEVVVVDQNDDDRLEPILARATKRLPIRHLRSPVRMLSHAKNVGLDACTGDIVCFPDDDCEYPDDTLARAAARFGAQSSLTFLSGPAVTSDGMLGSGRWHPRTTGIDIGNVWTSIIAFNFFIRREAATTVGGFDEELGIGARFGSAEEQDLAIRLLNAGGQGLYDYDLRVIHPDKPLGPSSNTKAYVYGTGLGRVLRKHRIGPRTTLTFMLRPAGGVVLSALQMRRMTAAYYWHTLSGRIAGYIAA